MEKTKENRIEPFSFDAAKKAEASPHPQAVHQMGFEGKRLKHRFRSRWHFLKTAKFWLALILLLGAAGAAVWFVKPARYWALNTAGVKAGVIIAVYDAKNDTAIIGADVEMDGVKYQTQKVKGERDGTVVIRNARFGTHTLKVSKNGYETSQRQFTVDQFARNLTEATPVSTKAVLTPTGLPVSAKVQNWLSGQPIEGAKLTYSDRNATTTKKGEATVNIAPTEAKEVEVQITADNYLPQTVKAKVDGDAITVKLVAAPKHYYLSTQAGKTGIYRSNLDGTAPELVSAGTGKEDPARLNFMLSPDNKFAAYISTRDGVMDPATKRPLLQLYIVNLEQGALTKIDEAVNLNAVGWLDSSLVYSKSVDRNGRLNTAVMSYVPSTKTKRTLSESLYYTSLFATRGKIYFAPGGEGPKNSEQVLMSITPDERQKILITSQPIASVARSDFGTIQYATTDGKWHEFSIDTNLKTELGAAPANASVMTFWESRSGQRVGWVTQRDGQDALLARATTPGAAEQVLARAAGTIQAVHWIEDSMIIYRVKSGKETADYIVSLNGGDPQKVSNVAATIAIPPSF